MAELMDLLHGLAKMTPAKGDVIVLRLKEDTEMSDIWPQLEDAAERDFMVLALTKDVEITTIKDDGKYVLKLPDRVPTDRVAAMRAEWMERFPNTTLSILVGGEIVEQPVSEDGLDTL